MKTVLTILLVCMVLPFVSAQTSTSFTQTINRFYAIGGSTASSKSAELDSYWNSVRKNGIPFIVGDSVAFLYRGDAVSVDWMGDFNKWGFQKSFHNKGHRIKGTDVWVLRTSFPRDARLDYKILVNGHQWLLDPENPNNQWSGVGGGSANSELRMPSWTEDPVLKEVSGLPKGTLTTDILLSSKLLNYQINYRVYLPYGYETLGKLPALYVTDGYEYLLPQLGDMETILNNLISQKKIQPIIVIFIDHREPVNRANNRRMDELNLNEKYLTFVSDELIPIVEAKYPIKSDAQHRAILGTSMGGLAAAYFAFTRPDIFSLAGIQSPSFGVRPQIYAICDNVKGVGVRVSMTTGKINDAGDGTMKMKEILEKNACVYSIHEVNDGHSWGNWRNTIDDILVDLFAAH